jgi:hypothetical protein
MSFAARIGIALGAFATASALAGVFGAASLGIALSFGQIGFALAVAYLIIRA